MDLIIEQNIGNSKIAILKCDEDMPYPKAHMDNWLAKYVEGELFNSFMDIAMDNPYVRVVIKGINDLQWVRLSDTGDIPVFAFANNAGDIRLILFFVPSYNINPYVKLGELAQICIEKDNSFRQFIDTHLDNPYIRLLIRNFDNLNFVEYNNQQL